MRSYKDSQNLTWDLSLNVLSVRKIKSRLEVDLLDNASLAAAMGNPLSVVDVIWVLVEEQATSRGISEDDWYKGAIDGNTFEESSVALMEELADFFRKTSRTLMAQMISETLKARPRVEAATAKQQAKIAETVTRMIEAAETELDQALSTAGK